MEKYNYVTLFNVHYLNRGLVMFDSLKKVSNSFNLYVVCFDDATYHILKSLDYEHLFPISLKEFEDEELLKIKPTRTATEYCWTCSSSVIWYCLKHYQLNNCAYIDADMYFYSDPSKIWLENESAEVYITLHHYSPAYDQSAISGKFCVQFVGFKNTDEAFRILEEWRNNCIKWCYNKVEDGKFGDQKYLDEWPIKYKSVHIVKDMAAGLAPWNIQQFEIITDKRLTLKKNGQDYLPVFYHFHKLKIFAHKMVSFTSSYYKIDQKVMETFYQPYAKKLLAMDKFLSDKYSEIYQISYETAKLLPLNPFTWLKIYLYYLKKNWKNWNAKNTIEKFKNDYTFLIK